MRRERREAEMPKQERIAKPRHRNRGTIIHEDTRTHRARTRGDQLRAELDQLQVELDETIEDLES